MASIDVREAREDDQGYGFEVRVGEAGTTSTHTVTMSRSDFERLGKGSASPEDFVEQCFAFLLEREPKESILRQFDVRQIGQYFPEFEAEIGRPQKSR